MTPNSILARMRRWIKPSGRRDGTRERPPPQPSDGPAPSATDADQSDDGNRRHRGTSLLRSYFSWGRERQRRVNRAGHDGRSIGDMFESVSKYLASNGKVNANVERNLDRLASGLHDLAQSERERTAAIQAFVGELQAINAQARRMETTLARIPEACDAQQRTLAEISRHTQAGRDLGERTLGSLENVQQTLGEVGDSTSKSVEALDRLRDAGRQRQEELERLIRVQAKRFTILLGAGLAIAAAATVTVLVVALR